MPEGTVKKGGPLPGPKSPGSGPQCWHVMRNTNPGVFFWNSSAWKARGVGTSGRRVHSTFRGVNRWWFRWVRRSVGLCFTFPLATRLLTEATDGPSVRYEVASNREGYSDDLPLDLQRIV